MRFILITVAFLGLLSFFGVNLAVAQPVEPTSTTSSEVSSYVLFWPLTAGKTEGDSLYSLKLFKEQVRGWFTFGDMNKADYAVELGTKRVLEAEKLLLAGKNDLAVKTLAEADSELQSVYRYVKNTAAKRSITRDEIRRDRLIYVKRLIDYLKIVAPEETHPGLDGVKESADAILRDYLP